MNPAHIDARVVVSSQMFGIGAIHVGAVCNLPLPIPIRAATRWRWEGHRSAMNPAHIDARVVMPSQMCFGIVVLNEIHVGAGFKPAPINSNMHDADAAAVERAIGPP